MTSELSRRGGSGRGQGRKPLADPTKAMRPVAIRMTDAQREKLGKLGGGRWVRARIDEAPIEDEKPRGPGAD